MGFDQLEKETDFKFIGRLQDAKVRAEDFARHSRAQSGLETGDGSNHQALLETNQHVSLTNNRRKPDKSSNNALWLDLIQRQIEELHTSIANAESGFVHDFGEDWREQFALALLDPDLMPQRLEGESLAEYRARVEQSLMDELLNEDGSIKDEYKDHPEYGELAQWAQWKHDQQQAQALRNVLSDPALSDEERLAKLETYSQSESYDRITQALNSTSANSAEGKVIDATQDTLEDRALSRDASASESAFLR